MPHRDDRTDHARVRMQQRGISADALDLLMKYGRYRHDRRGHVLVYMDKGARHVARRKCGRAAGPVLDRVSGMFAVLGANGVIVTVGHRYRRLPKG